MVTNFWKHLGLSAEESASVKGNFGDARNWKQFKQCLIVGIFIVAVESGHPDEDEIYENALISTNMIYEATEEELIPVEKFWAGVPKIQILDPNKVRNQVPERFLLA